MKYRLIPCAFLLGSLFSCCSDDPTDEPEPIEDLSRRDLNRRDVQFDDPQVDTDISSETGLDTSLDLPEEPPLEDIARESSSCGGAEGGLFISEIVDPNIGDPSRGRYIELYNGSDQAVALSGWQIVRHFDPEAQFEADLPTVTLAPCEVFVIARDDQGFQEVYGMAPDWVPSDGDGTSSVVDNNGDDAIGLHDSNGIVDQFGVPAESSGFPSWSYDDSVVRRNESVIAPSPTYQPAEWTVTPITDSSTGIATPGTH